MYLGVITGVRKGGADTDMRGVGGCTHGGGGRGAVLRSKGRKEGSRVYPLFYLGFFFVCAKSQGTIDRKGSLVEGSGLSSDDEERRCTYV